MLAVSKVTSEVTRVEAARELRYSSLNLTRFLQEKLFHCLVNSGLELQCGGRSVAGRPTGADSLAAGA